MGFPIPRRCKCGGVAFLYYKPRGVNIFGPTASGGHWLIVCDLPSKDHAVEIAAETAEEAVEKWNERNDGMPDALDTFDLGFARAARIGQLENDRARVVDDAVRSRIAKEYGDIERRAKDAEEKLADVQAALNGGRDIDYDSWG